MNLKRVVIFTVLLFAAVLAVAVPFFLIGRFLSEQEDYGIRC